MEKYKPGYLGKVIPADDPAKLTQFVTDKYESFSAIYDACKDHSDKISDLKPVESSSSDPTALTVKISTDSETATKIKEETAGDSSITVTGDTITANKK